MRSGGGGAGRAALFTLALLLSQQVEVGPPLRLGVASTHRFQRRSLVSTPGEKERARFLSCVPSVISVEKQTVYDTGSDWRTPSPTLPFARCHKSRMLKASS